MNTPAADMVFVLPDIEGCHQEWVAEKQGYKITLPNASILYVPDFLNEVEITRAIDYLLANEDGRYSNIPWKQDSVSLYGSTKLLPRLTSWHGNLDATYTYSGIVNTPTPWNPCLLYFRAKLLALLFSHSPQIINGDTHFNSVLLNYYRHGSDSIGWHSDNEKELGKNPVIASISLGENRPFHIRHKFDHATKFSLIPKSGSLLVMAGEMQDFWEHSISKTAKDISGRINLTYRTILPKP